MIDTSEGLYTVISGIPAIVSAATGGIYGEPGLPTEWVPTDGPTLFFIPNSFSGDTELPRISQSFQFRFYGSDRWAAKELFRVTYDNLHRKKHHTVARAGGGTFLFFYGWMASGGAWTIEPETEWEYYMATWDFQFYEGLLA